jgi:hypothetical protein
MANLEIRDGDSLEKYLKATGAGTNGDPFIVEHLDTNSAALLTAAQAIQTAVEILDNIVSGSEAQVDIVTSALPTGAATASNQSTGNSSLSTIAGDTTSLDAKVATGGGLEASAVLVTIASDSTGVLSVDDNGGSLTVDGTVTETNSSAILADTANMDTNLGTVAGAVSGTEMQVDVVAALPAGDNNIGNVDIASAIPAGTNIIGKTQPFAALTEGGLTELIGINEQVDQNEYSASVGVALGGTYSGEILNISLYSDEAGSGTVPFSSGHLILLDADPATSAGDAALAAGEWPTIIGRWDIAAADWIKDANGGQAQDNAAIAFHALSTLYFVWFHTDAISLNDGAGDDERLRFNFWYRRDS